MLPFCCHIGHKHGKKPLFTGFFKGVKSFPLNSPGGLRGEVVEHAVHAGDFVDYAVGDVLKELKGNVLNGGDHGVGGVDGADDDRVGFGAFSVGNADGAEVGNGGEILPDFALKTVFGELLAEDSVGFADAFKTVAGDCAEAAHAETGTREGLTVNHVVRKTEGFAHYADFVLEKKFKGLDELELEVLGKSAHVVVSLDAVALKNVGIDGALGEELDALEFASFLLENADELGADDFALFLRLGNAGELVKETVYGVNVNEVGVHLVAENLHHLFGLALAEKSVVHVDADKLLPDGFDKKGGDDGGVNSAGKGKKDLFVPDLGAKLLYLFLNESLGKSRGGDALHIFGAFIALHKYSSRLKNV